MGSGISIVASIAILSPDNSYTIIAGRLCQANEFQGELDWRAARESIARLRDERFARRLKWAWKVQRLMFLGPLQGVVVRFIPRWEGLWRLLLARTR